MLPSGPEDCLPVELRGADTTLSRVAAGLSGASVYRVEARGRVYVLKVSPLHEPVDGWRLSAGLLRSAAAVGIAPRVVHVDEARRAVVCEFVSDRSVVALFAVPATRSTAIVALGTVLRRAHALPVPPGAASRDPRAFLEETWAGLAGFPLPGWVGEAVRRALDEPPPPVDRAPVLSHNDPNPSNLVFDGERILLLDWDSAGPNDPFYDLAAVALFLRLDDARCAQLIAAHDEAQVDPVLPARFTYLRRIIAALCGTLFLSVARAGGHQGARGGETLDLAPALGAGDARTPEGQWQFGQALLKASVKLFT